MRTTIVLFALLLSLSAATAAAAFDLGNRMPVTAKPHDDSVYQPPAGPPRQGGNTIEEAVPIIIPGTWTGTTVGYTDNYMETCPFGSAAPDVVYAVTPDEDMYVTIDLCNTWWDTLLYVYDENMNLIGCNAEAGIRPPCYVYSSKLEYLPFQSGMTYYIIIDGVVSSAGQYQMDITLFVIGSLDCPSGAQLENEPPLVDGYQDAWNGGCNSPEFGNPFQVIDSPVFCGVSGWYISATGSASRDTDWFHITMPESGVLEIIGDAEFSTYMFELFPQDCGSVGVVQNVIIGPYNEATMTIVGAPGSLVWFWVGPTTFTGPVNEYNYVLHLNLDEQVQAERHSWTSIKSLFH